MKPVTKKRFQAFDPKGRKRTAWFVALLIIANEIRGLFVVAAILKAMF